MLGEVRKRLDQQGLGPAMLAAPGWGSGGILARAMAIHGIPGVGAPLALDRGKAMPIQMDATSDCNGVPTRNPGSFLRVLGQRLPTYTIQGLGNIIIDGELGL
jgi:hypothetical protein